MKASRLLALLLLLQTRQRLTTAELAERLEVSRRTVLRDVDALSAAGVPVYAERGRHGGVVLLPGARLNASHLDPVELDVLALTGLDDQQLASLGLADVATLTERKLDARRRNAPGTGEGVPLRSVVVTDNRPWAGEEPGGTEPAALVAVLRAGVRVRIEYRRSGERSASTSVVDPYGIASKAGRWYLVADRDGTPRLFALTRLTGFTVLAEPAVHREGATLDGVWAELRDRVERAGVTAFEIRLRRTRLDLARRILGSRLADVRDEDDEWSLATVHADDPEAVRQLLQFGDHIEVLAPESARRRIVELAHDLADRHAPAGPAGRHRGRPRPHRLAGCPRHARPARPPSLAEAADPSRTVLRDPTDHTGNDVRGVRATANPTVRATGGRRRQNGHEHRSAPRHEGEGMTERAETTQDPTPQLPEGPVDLRLVAVDMDGTLLDPNGAPPPELPALLADLAERGVVFAPASGRQYATLAQLFGPLAAGLTFIAENGSYVVRDGVEVSSLTLSPDLVTRVVARIRELARAGGDLGVVVCGKRSAWIERSDDAFLAQVRTYYEELAIVEDLDEVDDEVLKLAVFDFAGAEQGAYPALAELPGTHRTIVSSHNWIDVMHPEADKGAALAALRERLGLTVEQTAAFGDYLNDLGMLGEAGLSFAMANAHPDVIERARYLAPSNAEDGVVRTIRRLLD